MLVLVIALQRLAARLHRQALWGYIVLAPKYLENRNWNHINLKLPNKRKSGSYLIRKKIFSTCLESLWSSPRQLPLPLPCNARPGFEDVRCQHRHFACLNNVSDIQRRCAQKVNQPVESVPYCLFCQPVESKFENCSKSFFGISLLPEWNRPHWPARCRSWTRLNVNRSIPSSTVALY